MNGGLEFRRREKNLPDLFLCLIHWWFLLGCCVVVGCLFWVGFLMPGLFLFFNFVLL